MKYAHCREHRKYGQVQGENLTYPLRGILSQFSFLCGGNFFMLSVFLLTKQETKKISHCSRNPTTLRILIL